MISGAFSSISRLSRLLRLITRRYRSFRSEVAKRPPSSCTIGRRSGGITGSMVRIIHSGLLPLLRKFSTTRSRLVAFLRRWPWVVCTSACKSSAIFSRSTVRTIRSRIAPAPISALNTPGASSLKLVLLLAHQRIKLALEPLLEPLALLDNFVLLAFALGIGQQLGRRHIALA